MVRFLVGAIVCLAPLTFFPAPAASQIISEIEIRDTANDDDDYLCWSPVSARIRLVSGSDADQTVMLKSEKLVADAGSVRFFANVADASPTNFDPRDKIELTLPASGEWVPFFVAGQSASKGSKDVLITAEIGGGGLAAKIPVMVRVRKNAESLTAKERDALLAALVNWKNSPGFTRLSRFEDYYTAHDDAFELGIHTRPTTPVNNFLPWHRALLMSLERELQAFDRTVSLPYWNFDNPAPNLFHPNFLGARSANSTVVRFGQENPIDRWQRRDFGDLVRLDNWDVSAPINPGILPIIRCAVGNASCPVALGQYGIITGAIEGEFHNGAHGGSLGWLGTGTSPSDPLFFLLHANVDRGWAHWQAVRHRYVDTGQDAGSYAPIGKYPGAGGGVPAREGVYALDEMWPWGTKSGDGGTPGDEMDNWPPYRFPFPSAPGLPFSASAPPTPAMMVDYLGIHAADPAHGVCYDDIGFLGEDPTKEQP